MSQPDTSTTETSAIPLLPARMVNEYAYCPRLAVLMWVQQEWADSADTVQGRAVHKRVDQPGRALAPAGEGGERERIHARSVDLSSERLGVIARLDLVEAEGRLATPVDYKRGKRPHVDRGAYDPERIQLCLQGMLLEEHGYQAPSGVLYYAASRERVAIKFDEELRTLTQNTLDDMRRTLATGRTPEPLVDSPKCPRCALAGICLPDETRFLRCGPVPVRPLAVADPPGLPLHVQSYRGKVALEGETLVVTGDDGATETVRLRETSQLVLAGNVYLTTPALHELMRREIPVTWTSYGGWFLGHTIGLGHKNVELRTAQYAASVDPLRSLAVARALVANKLLNQRTVLRRNCKSDTPPETALEALKSLAAKASECERLDSLLGIEGAGAAHYFRAFGSMLAPEMAVDFDFETRNRRPPTDPVNAVLSFVYAMLTRAFSITLSSVGFDIYRGFYHQPRYGRPALALDLMEPFRPLLADSVVLQVINNGEISSADCVRAAGAVALTDRGRKAVVAAFERRLSQEITHPLFGYRLSYRRLLELHSRLFGRYLDGELPDCPQFLTR
ncbi:MAG: CRISPR-associated endonuclease Cas1 [Rhodocyclaceae bacterium]|nr:CRISPR-associated endonuclease Cas1 [Rhodocyclaceae bacterium]MBX3667965.1 CRISPR-associated endonuclease Cas1 [Rhodocyclaceae bacterium]